VLSMSRLNRLLALTFTFLVLSSLIVLSVVPVTAQVVNKPSVPQFSVECVNQPYDVPPTTSKDPYSGVTTYTPGYRADNWTIIFTIKNQPFTPYTDEKGMECKLHYCIQGKGHFADDYSYNWKGGPPIEQSKSEYTVVSYTSGGKNGDQIDYRVKAASGYITWISLVEPGFKIDAESDWSNIQTLTIPDRTWTTAPPSITYGPTENQPQFPDQTQPPNSIFTNPFFLLSISVIFCVVVVVTMVMILLKRQKNKTHYKHTFQGVQVVIIKRG
ncbi:MAG: hypothetical protein FWF27_06550, partial [Candidatus Bathyarchaeota archaeon]|nr:hypothetical protein [Candidatus Termiticorpusculum sp.]